MAVKIHVQTEQGKPIIVTIRDPIVQLLNDANNIEVTGGELVKVWMDVD